MGCGEPMWSAGSRKHLRKRGFLIYGRSRFPNPPRFVCLFVLGVVVLFLCLFGLVFFVFFFFFETPPPPVCNFFANGSGFRFAQLARFTVQKMSSPTDQPGSICGLTIRIWKLRSPGMTANVF